MLELVTPEALNVLYDGRLKELINLFVSLPVKRLLILSKKTQMVFVPGFKHINERIITPSGNKPDKPSNKQPSTNDDLCGTEVVASPQIIRM